jgi:hypothetical protein
LKVMEQTVQDAPDQQVSLTDPDARSMGIHVIDVSQIDGNIKKVNGPLCRRAEHHRPAGLPSSARPARLTAS